MQTLAAHGKVSLCNICTAASRPNVVPSYTYSLPSLAVPPSPVLRQRVCLCLHSFFFNISFTKFRPRDDYSGNSHQKFQLQTTALLVIDGVNTSGAQHEADRQTLSKRKISGPLPCTQRIGTRHSVALSCRGIGTSLSRFLESGDWLAPFLQNFSLFSSRLFCKRESD